MIPEHNIAPDKRLFPELLEEQELPEEELALVEEEGFVQRAIAYLLEELTDEEARQFEDEGFARTSWAAQMRLVEEDLIDAYLRAELTQARRQGFERNYLVTEARQQRVLTAAALLRHGDAIGPTKPTWAERFRAFWSSQAWSLRPAAVLAVVVIIIGSAMWLTRPRPHSPQTFAALTLAISTSNRAEGVQAGKVKLSPNHDALKISLLLPVPLPPAARYRVELENESGATKPLEIAGQDAQTISVVITAAQLARGQYVLKLFAIKDDGTEQRVNGSYFFIIE